jgi:Restriction endonuclease
VAEKLKVVFIRLDSGKENQLENIKQNRLLIGYSSNNDEIFEALNSTPKLTDEKFKELVKKITNNNLAHSALKTIYEDDGNTLWFTIVDGLLYYGFTDIKSKFKKSRDEKDIEYGCVRPMEDGWSKQDSRGNDINERSVSGKITKKRIFRGTTSEVASTDVRYLVYRILNKDTDEKKLALKSQENLLKSIQELLPQLNEYDFETLVEMLFLSQGYEKIAKSSGAEMSFDLALKRPFDRNIHEHKIKPTFVQIKSTIDNNVISEVYKNFISDKAFGGYHNIGFLVSHSFKENLGNSYSENGKELIFIGPKEIAQQCVEFGKVDWLLEKVV